MKKATAILVWGVPLWAIGTWLDQVRMMLMLGEDVQTTYWIRFGAGLALAAVVVLAARGLRRWTGKRMMPGDWFMSGAVAWSLQGLFNWRTGVIQDMDVQIHDTYIVVPHTHVYSGVILLFVLLGVLYYTGRAMNRVLGLLHFTITHAALFVLFWMKYFNPAYQVKEYLDYHEFQTLGTTTWGYEVMAALLLAAQLLFTINLFISFFRRTRRTGRTGRIQ
ncbi:MAG TPA: hypothetical protein VN616_01990 [Puia sp.]|nr:hypothetical protein [Puia sp.]